MKIYVGTSGYMISESKWWSLKKFNSLEINSTFYRNPNEDTWKKWYELAPEDFLYSVKMNQYMTHKKRLIDAQDTWNRFWVDGAQNLKDRLGAILFQFPPSFKNNNHISKIDNKTNFERLKELKNILPKDIRFAFEFRDSSWFSKEVIDFLKEQNWCLVNFFVDNSKSWFGDIKSGFYPQIKTADFEYVRLHGPSGKFKGSYNKEQLEQVKNFLTSDINFVYFNNTFFNNRSDSCILNDEKVKVAAICNANEFIDL